jgi:hypothetical protein
MATKHRLPWTQRFDERELRLIDNCRVYGENDPAGLPGHNLMIIIAKMAELLDMGVIPYLPKGEGQDTQQ